MKMLALLAAIAAAAPVQETPDADEPKTVIVTAKRLDVTQKALADCIARSCPPDQEIDAALAHAENLFVDGAYFDARKTLMATIGRVDKRAKDYPEAVGDIWRAQARIAQHMGERDHNRIGQFESLDSLRAGIDRKDARVFAQRIAVADTLAREGRTDLAKTAFRDIAADARKAGVPHAQGTALLRIALIEGAFYELQPAAFGVGLDRAVDELLATTDPVLGVYRDAARLLRARLKLDPNDAVGIDRLVTEFSPPAATRPIMIYQPRLADEASGSRPERTLDGRAPPARPDAGYEGQWADVTFRITPDGRVHDVDVVREGPKFEPEWMKATLTSIAGRRYAPLTLPSGKTSLRRIERYTLTSYWEKPTGTRVRTRSYPRIEMLDLSPEVATAEVAPTGGGSAANPL